MRVPGTRAVAPTSIGAAPATRDTLDLDRLAERAHDLERRGAARLVIQHRPEPREEDRAAQPGAELAAGARRETERASRDVEGGAGDGVEHRPRHRMGHVDRFAVAAQAAAPGEAVAPQAVVDEAQRLEPVVDQPEVELLAGLVGHDLPDVGQLLARRQPGTHADARRPRRRTWPRTTAAPGSRPTLPAAARDQHPMLMPQVAGGALRVDDGIEPDPARRPVAGERGGEDRVRGLRAAEEAARVPQVLVEAAGAGGPSRCRTRPRGPARWPRPAPAWSAGVAR